MGIAEGRFGTDHVKAELGELVINSTAARQNSEQVTIFKSLGLACEDVAAAQRVLISRR
jgi:alanine dehydrogenase